MLFIDEIHRLNHIVEEVLYPAMEDYQIDIMIGQGPAARSIKLRSEAIYSDRRHYPFGLADFAAARSLWPEFTVWIFTIPQRLARILKRSAAILGVASKSDGIAEIAARSRGTPRIANRLLRRVRDYAQVKGDGTITKAMTDEALQMLRS